MTASAYSDSMTHYQNGLFGQPSVPVLTCVHLQIELINNTHKTNEIRNQRQACCSKINATGSRGINNFAGASGRKRKWRWIGHTLRKPLETITRQAITWNPPGKRRRGRPRNTWQRDTEKDTKEMGYTRKEMEKMATDRKQRK